MSGKRNRLMRQNEKLPILLRKTTTRQQKQDIAKAFNAMFYNDDEPMSETEEGELAAFLALPTDGGYR